MKSSINNLKKIFIRKNEFFKNTFSIGLMQGINQILPLLIAPYLLKAIGVENYGILTFSLVFISYFMLVTDYGFNSSATRQIAINIDNREEINRIFSAVYTIKTIFMAISFFIIMLICLLFPKFNKQIDLYFILLLMLPGQVMHPMWLYQGMEQVKSALLITNVPKILSVCAIILLVKNPEDFLLVPLFLSLGFLFAGLFALIKAVQIFNLKYSLPSKFQLFFQLKEGWGVFVSSISTSFYTNSTIFILGLYSSDSTVGYFSIVDKFILFIKGLYIPFTQAIYPVSARLFSFNKSEGLNFIKKIAFVLGFIMFIVGLLIFLYSDVVIQLILGNDNPDTSNFLKILSFLPLLTFLSNILGVQIMLNSKASSSFSKILLSAAILGLFLSFLLIPKYLAYGTCWSIILVELFITASMAIFVKVKILNESI